MLSPKFQRLNRDRRRIGTLFVSLVLAVSTLGAVSPSSASAVGSASSAATSAQVALADRWKPPAGAKFNVPRAGGEPEYRLERAVIAAIDHAKPKTTIKMAMFSFDRVQVSDALIRAKRRKVRVQVIVNGHEFPRAQRDLKRVLGGKRFKTVKRNGHKKRVARKNFFYQCQSACRGDGDVQHSKFVLFEKSGAAKKVVMLGSLNMKLNGVRNQFNDLLTVRDSPKMYDKLRIIFKEMRNDRTLKDSRRVYRDGKKYRLEVMPFPRTKATKKTRWTPKRDPVMKTLDKVHCKGARTNDGRTIIRVNMHAWDKSRGALIANRFRDLYAEGCNVMIMVGFAGAKVRNIFARPTARGLVPVRSTGFDTNGDQQIDLYSHDKILTINGHYAKKRDRKMVLTGSSNYQNGGQYGDEIFFRVFSPKIYRQYADNWGYVWRNHTHGFRWSRTSALRGGPTWVGPQYTLEDGLGTDSPEWRDE
ncbi:hypothetical protein ncot_14380 [Nocardioides sp. JQ2195]|uniref:phospholipase D-like domain-containing protein n=1 Tax=Nocardioides sp. JQ2195 TaxID=2592334 RepID=UPI00143E4C8C|nr:phospholipase D-like domain-containing protein [Nocardioides sp. JQ2195]QIX27650.1 hypothetical protein ncot_14380 [Nocardioides sp. JQ2195]